MSKLVLDLNGAASGTNATVTFVEQTAVQLNEFATLTDNGNHTISQLILTLSDAAETESLYLDEIGLAAASAAGLTVGYVDGVLSITGSASTTIYQSILDHIYYNDSSDSPLAATRTVTVSATDSANKIATATTTINVTAVDDAPTALALDATVIPVAVTGATIGTLAATDADAGETFTYTVNDSRFVVEGNVLKLADNVAFEPTANFDVQITVTDSGGLSFTQTFTLGTGGVTTGRAFDGYIAHATVFGDTDGDGVLDAGEAWATTDENGNFTLVGASGPLVMLGGGGATDISTGEAFTGTLTAPEGATVINPLTTLVQSLIASQSVTEADATQTVLQGLGLDTGIDLGSYDPIAEVLLTDSETARETIAAAISVQNTIVQMASLLEGAGATAAVALASVTLALATQIDTDGTVNLTDSDDITTLLTQAALAASVSGNLSQATIDGATDVITASNVEANATIGSATSATDLLQQLAQVQNVAQNDSAAALEAAAAAPDPDAAMAQVVGDFTGASLETRIDAAPVGNVVGANGDDVINGTSGADDLRGYGGNDTLDGLDGDDRLDGGTGNDTLYGGADDDELLGGRGDDVLYGGLGNDRYTIVRGDGSDTISDDGGIDTLGLVGRGGLRGLVDVSRDGDDMVVTLQDGATIRVEDQFAGTGNEIEFLQFPEFFAAPVLAGTGGTFAFTGDLDVSGQAGNWLVVGYDGNDTLRGGTGANLLFGHDGDDVLYGGPRDDYMEGGAGADTLYGGTADTLGVGGNLASYVHSPSAVTIDFENNLAFGGHADGDTLVDMTGVIGSDYDDTFYGSSALIPGQFFANQRWTGGKGNDYIDGRGGPDSVEYQDSPHGVAINLGGPSFDVTSVGNDFVFGNTGDGPVYTVASGQAIDGWEVIGAPGTFYIDTLVNVERLRGSIFDDVLVGSNIGEVFRPRGGDDYVDGRGGFDIAEYIVSLGPVVINISDTDYVVDADTIVAAHTAHDGSVHEDGSPSVDTLIGIEGIRGSTLDDILIGDAFNNYLHGANGDDYIDGGAGFDQADYSGDTTYPAYLGQGLKINLSDAAVVIDANLTLDARTALDPFGNIDTFAANAGDSTLASVEQVNGTEDGDIMFGDAGNNNLFGNGGDDILFGGGGNDTLGGGNGNDTLIGGTGNDALGAGAGDDLFVFAPGDGADLIHDFTAGAGTLDKIDLSAYASIDSIDDLVINDVSGNAVIDLGGGDTITIAGVLSSQLHAEDFLF